VKHNVKELLKIIGVVLLSCLVAVLILLALGWEAEAKAQTPADQANQCIGAILSSYLDDRIVDPIEANLIVNSCTPEALGFLGARPTGCAATEPENVTCGFPRRSARRHPEEFKRYTINRGRLIHCRYAELAGNLTTRCERLYVRLRARWVPSDKPEQVRFLGQIYRWVS
jgi:hypothetical protein